MRIIRKETDYAIRALYFINKRAGKSAVSQIYSQIKVPRHFLRKIFRMLASNGILTSKKGRNGGFEFKKPFDSITVADINEIFDEMTPMGGCPFKSRICSNFRHCYLKEKIRAIEQETYHRLKKIYIRDMEV